MRIRRTKGTRKLAHAAISLAFAGAVVGLVPSGASAAGTMAIDCETGSSGVQDSCGYQSGESFFLDLQATDAPGEGYNAIQLKLLWPSSKLAYKARKTTTEAVWPDCTLPVRQGSSSKSPLLFGCVVFPVPKKKDFSHYEGTLAKFRFKCKQDGDAQITMAPYGTAEKEGDPLGTTFITGESGQTSKPDLKNATVKCGASGSAVSKTESSPKQKAKAKKKKVQQACEGLKDEALVACLTGLAESVTQTTPVTPASATPAQDEDDGTDAWVWAAIVGALAAGGLLGWLIARRRMR